ncbi:potassium transporter Kef [Parashewanella curva]|uniref:Potassium transporter Kef n=1 Tax=Parashewanella curva TaxID=2338552 RepID=A0A3L8PYC8_9GAMM|nr:cation:proton antiporter family protein [Parashewanella curva]RLV60447.1 potassium transporter Kef [Parashewanella curva]
MEPVLLVITFLCGMLINRLGFPPLIGYLIAGFALYYVGVKESTIQFLHQISELGITLLLFAIGLKLDIKSLFKKEVLATSSIHLLGSILVFVPLLKLLGFIGLQQITDLGINQLFLIAFALSFSSTVFAVKTLEDQGNMQALSGKVAIGILIIQDIFAVAFLTISKGEVPSVWAFCLLLLPLLKPLLYYIMDKLGHGELTVLFGLVMAFVLGAWTFQLVGLKADLGALIIGILLSGNAKASALSKSLFYFKEVFLIAFFLSIGLNGFPSLHDITLAVILALLLPFKVTLFLLLLTRFQLRARTALLSAFNLANYSEFGLIVMAVAITMGMIPSQWLVILAVALSISFIVAAWLNRSADAIYNQLEQTLLRLQAVKLHPEDSPIAVGTPRFLILGMGRIGSGAYDALKGKYGCEILGVEHKTELVEFHQSAGRNVVHGDASDCDFWKKVDNLHCIERVFLAMPKHSGNISALEQLKEQNYQGKFSVLILHAEDAESLEELGVDNIYNLYDLAGVGFVEQVISENKD